MAVKALAKSKYIPLRLKSDVLGGTPNLLLWAHPEQKKVKFVFQAFLSLMLIGACEQQSWNPGLLRVLRFSLLPAARGSDNSVSHTDPHVYKSELYPSWEQPKCLP